MFIIVEGPSLAGKTTLVNALRARLLLDGQVQLEHKGPPAELTRRWVLKDYVLDHENYVPASDTSLLADRWHYGEYCYAPIYRPETNKDGYGLLGSAGWRWVELFLLAKGALIVQLDARDEVLFHRFEDRGDNQIDNPADLFEVARNYREVGKHSVVPRLTYDTSAGKPIDIDPIWFRALQEETLATDIHAITPEYIGNPRPDVLLIGDKRNVTKRYGDETRSAFMPVDNSSGTYLLESLPEHFWPKVGLINGNDLAGNLRELWEILGRPRPISLGNQATRALTRAGFEAVEFSTLRHPAFTRRFEYASQGVYGERIAKAAQSKGTYA